jgi:hypothetical protein
MRVFVYRHWDSELALVGDWPADAAEARLRALHEQLWSDSPPGLQADASADALAEVAATDHPLGRALTLLYHVSEQRLGGQKEPGAAACCADLLRASALRVLGEPPLLHLDAATAAQRPAAQAVTVGEGSFLRQLALSALRELAQPSDAVVLAARLAADDATATAEERAAALAALSALARREPAVRDGGLLAQLLDVAAADRSALVRVEAVQALMSISPTPMTCAALRELLIATAAPAEPEWAMATELFRCQPAHHAALLLQVYRRSEPPAAFVPLYTRLALYAEDALLRQFLGRCSDAAPLLFHDADGSVFALCQRDGTPPAGSDDAALPELAARWISAADAARTALLVHLCGRGHVAGRALAILAGPAAEPDADLLDEPAPAGPAAPEVDWLALARAVLADPPLVRLRAADLAPAGDASLDGEPVQLLNRRGQPACNHQMALKALAALSAPGPEDALRMVRCFLQTAGELGDWVQADDPVLATATEALYFHSQRHGEPPPGPQILEAMTTLARDGTGETRRRAVQILGRWPAAQTAELLRALARDPTYAVCCVADRALAEQRYLLTG